MYKYKIVADTMGYTGGSGAMNKKAGEMLKQLRRRKNESLFKVARAVHISGNYLSELERGLKEPSDMVLESLADYYKVDNSELFSLYGRISPSDVSVLLENPDLHRVLVKISLDERLTDEERKHIYMELKRLYEEFKGGNSQL